MKKNNKILIILVSILLSVGLIFIVLYVSNFNKDDNKEIEYNENINKDLKITKSSSSNKTSFLNERYLIEYINKTKEDCIGCKKQLFKIIDLYNDKEYKFSNIFYNEIYEDYNNNIYIINKNTENDADFLKQEGNSFKKVYKLSDKIDSHYINEICYTENDYAINSPKYLLGFFDSVNNKIVFTNENTLENVGINSTNAILAVPNPYYVAEKDNIIVKKDNKYGIYNIPNNKLEIDYIYEYIINNNDNYIALQNNKYGVIDINNNILLDFIYDFIIGVDDYYVVSKNNKMAIMNNNFKLITDYEFDYQESSEKLKYDYELCCGRFNTVNAGMYNDKIYLTINNNELYNNVNYPKHNTYIISKDGIYKTITTNEFIVENNIPYSYDSNKNMLTIYNDNIDKLFDVDYKYKYVKNITLLEDNIYKIDDKYYDSSTGKKIDSDTKLEYKPFNNKEYNFSITYKDSDKEDSKIYKYNDTILLTTYRDNKFNKIKNKYVYVDNNKYIIIEKK